MGAPIAVTVRLFASLREAAGGAGRLRVDVAAPARVADVWDRLPSGVRGGGGPPPGLRYAVNDEWADAAAPLADGDVVALVLPVSGG